jgi:O-antigen/teichoic acid export membrane protein
MIEPEIIESLDIVQSPGSSEQRAIQPADTPIGQDITKLASGASVTFAGRVVGSGSQVLTQVALARLFGPQGYGLYAIGWTLLRMGEVVGTLGLDNGVIHFASRYWPGDPARLKGVLLQALAVSFSSGVLLGWLLFVLAPWLADQVFQNPDLTPILQLFAFAFPFVTGLKVAAASTRVSQRMRFAVYAEDAGRPTLNLILVVIFYALSQSIIGAVAAAVLSFVLALILSLYFVHRLFPATFAAHPRPVFSGKALLAFSLPTALAGIFGMFITWVDRLFVGYFRSETEVGIYQAVAQFSVIFALTLSAVNAIFAPMIANLYHQGHMTRLNELFKISTKWVLYLSFPVFLVIVFAPVAAITVIFGSQYVSGSTALVILAIAQLVNVGTGSVGYLLVMTGRQKSWLVITGSMFAASLLLNVTLVPRLGLNGAALSSAIAFSSIFLLGLLTVRRRLGLWPYDRRYYKGLLAAVLTVGALVVLHWLPLNSAFIQLLTTTLVSIGVFGGTLIMLGLDQEDREFVSLLRRRLRR